MALWTGCRDLKIKVYYFEQKLFFKSCNLLLSIWTETAVLQRVLKPAWQAYCIFLVCSFSHSPKWPFHTSLSKPTAPQFQLMTLLHTLLRKRVIVTSIFISSPNAELVLFCTALSPLYCVRVVGGPPPRLRPANPWALNPVVSRGPHTSRVSLFTASFLLAQKHTWVDSI